jgi:hypothetical protein
MKDPGEKGISGDRFFFSLKSERICANLRINLFVGAKR